MSMSNTLAIQILIYMVVLGFIAAAWGYTKGYKEGRAFQRKITHKYSRQAVNHGDN
jgi:hypothetical protein